jgi:mannose-6-phosphate isomerase-like protein (cupin superfamily)
MSMRVLLPCLVAVTMMADAFAQTPAPPAKPPAETPAQPPATAPATPPETAKKPAPVRRQQSTQSQVPTSVTITLTDASGAPIDNVHVSATGPVSRQTLSIDTGIARLNSVKPGDYRLRFEHEGFITLERDLTVKGGSPATIDVSLSPAPPPPKAPEPAPSAVSNAPPGKAQYVDLADFIEKHFISGGDPQKEDEIGCTAAARATLLQVRDSIPEKARTDADEAIFVIAGEGTLRLGNQDVPLSSKEGTFAVVPRGTVRGLTRTGKGKSPLIVLSVVAGPPCTK